MKEIVAFRLQPSFAALKSNVCSEEGSALFHWSGIHRVSWIFEDELSIIINQEIYPDKRAVVNYLIPMFAASVRRSPISQLVHIVIQPYSQV